jgi:hypothetical protein
VLTAPKRRKILYVGELNYGGTSTYRFEALKRLAQDMVSFNPEPYLSKSPVVAKIRYWYPVGPLISKANRELLRVFREHKPDVVWFDKPLVFTPETVEEIKTSGALTICFNQDNPFGPRNDGCWMQFKKMYRLMDLHCLLRNADIPRYQSWKLPFIKIQLSYEPAAHFPPPADWDDACRTREVSFTGSPYDQRAVFLTTLGEQFRLPVLITGYRWKDELSRKLFDRYVTGGNLDGAAYRENIWKSKINLAFVTHSNEEDVAHKAFEIAACGSFLLAERTAGHMAMFEEDREAVFFSSVEECADKCRFYLPRPDLREAIAWRGRERAVKSGYDNDTQLRKVLLKLDGIDIDSIST